MEKGFTPNLLRLTFIVCVFFGLLNAFINHPIQDALAGLMLGVVGILVFCSMLTPGGMPPTVGMVLSVSWIIGIVLVGTIFFNDTLVPILDRFQYHSEMWIFGFFNPMSLPEGAMWTDTMSFFVGTSLALTAVFTICVFGMIRTK